MCPSSSLLLRWRSALERGLGWFALGVGICSAGACNRAPCGGLHPPNQHRLAPHIVSAGELQQDVIDPYSFVFELLYLAPHGDLHDGTLSLYIANSPPAQLPLAPYFGPSNVNPTATSGRLAIPVHFSPSALQDDALLRLGMQLQDGSRFWSNCMTLELHVLVDRLGARSVKASRAYATKCGSPTLTWPRLARHIQAGPPPFFPWAKGRLVTDVR